MNIDRVIKEIRKTSIPIVTNRDYPPSWWNTEFAQIILHNQSEALNNLIVRITEGE